MDAPGSPAPGSGVLDHPEGGVRPAPATERPAVWQSIELVMRAHSQELTEAAARLAVTATERPDVCPRGHPRNGRCRSCHEQRLAARRARERADRDTPAGP